MKKYVIALGSLALLATTIAWAEETLEDQCRRFAVEDGIPAEEMDSYIKQCITDLEQAEKDMPLDLDTVPEDAPAPAEEPSDNKE
jgi:hypothetical protein